MHLVYKYAILNALGTALYVAAVGSFLYYAPQAADEFDSVILPIAMLLLLVASVAVTGSLLFGRPLFWYFNGQKKEAISLLLATLSIFFLITLLALFAIITQSL